MSDVKVETIEVPEDEANAIADEVAEEEWESDWGAVLWGCFFTVLIICGLGIAAWQPWVVI